MCSPEPCGGSAAERGAGISERLPGELDEIVVVGLEGKWNGGDAVRASLRALNGGDFAGEGIEQPDGALRAEGEVCAEAVFWYQL